MKDGREAEEVERAGVGHHGRFERHRAGDGEGGGGKALSAMDKYMPRLGDKVMETFMFDAQKSQEPPRPREDHGLYKASGELKERSGKPAYVSESSLYTKASLHPVLTGALLVGAGLAVAALLRPARPNGHGHARRASFPSAAGLPAAG